MNFSALLEVGLRACMIGSALVMRGMVIVDIGLVHHVAVRVFSCTLSEESYLYCKVMTSISTCMSLTLTRMCGEW